MKQIIASILSLALFLGASPSITTSANYTEGHVYVTYPSPPDIVVVGEGQRHAEPAGAVVGLPAIHIAGAPLQANNAEANTLSRSCNGAVAGGVLAAVGILGTCTALIFYSFCESNKYCAY